MRFLYILLYVAGLISLMPALAYASTSVSVGSLSPGTTVAVGTSLSFVVSTSGFTSPVFSVNDSFSGSSASTNDIDSNGYFVWTPTSNDIGTHTVTVNISDSAGDSSAVQEVITVSAQAQNNPVVSIQGLNPGTAVVVGSPLTFTAAASSFTNPSFTVSDSYVGSSISNAAITPGGTFSWTPAANQIGTHTLTVYASDSLGHSANVVQQILVQNPNITVTSISPSNNITPGATLTFTLSQAGLVNPNYTLTDSFTGTSGTTITNSNINSSGVFTWTPTAAQVGTHQVMLYANDSQGHAATTTISLYVIQPVQVALTAPAPGSTIAPGTTVVLNATAFGFTNPAFVMTDSFPGTSLTNANINAAGAVSWTPTISDIGTHTITVSASDTYSHLSTAQTTITVAGTPVTTNPSTGSGQATSAFQFENYLSPGMTSQDVTQLQTILAQQGYFSGTATGYYGPLTEAAVVKYQAAHGLDQLGVVGPATRAALNAGSASTTTSIDTNGYVFNNFLNVGSSGADVTALQQKLTALNLYSGPITGYFGSLTKAAVEAFQGQHNISQVGYVGPSTRAALNQ